MPIIIAIALTVLAILTGVSTGADSRADPYTFTAVDVPGATVTVVNGLNDRGDVVGWYRTGISGEPNSVDHGFLLRYGKFTTIDVPGSQGVTVARGINNRGDIVGYYLTDNPTVPLLGFLLSRHGKFTIIDCGPFTEPHGINDRRDIVGRGGFDNEGFLLRNGKCIPIGVPGAITTTVEGINNAGDIVGWYNDPSGRHGFVLSHGRFTTIDPPQSIATEAIGINDDGDVVGSYESSIGHHGFVFLAPADDHRRLTSTHERARHPRGQFIDVDVPFPGAFFTNIFAINNFGDIGGEYDLSFENQPPRFPPHGFVATPGEDSNDDQKNKRDGYGQ